MKQYIVSDKQKRTLYFRALHFGEGLMPGDCAEIIQKYFRSKSTRQAIGQEQLALIIMELMERCGFCSEYEIAMDEASFLV